ncbi:hypothetical protein NTG1052_960005 [Candidatus Nitrotoga sp. 1052]|nr:hypothetical protein NTG1052_960005 [Candidatus Nitrotoga sp. 1052]
MKYVSISSSRLFKYEMSLKGLDVAYQLNFKYHIYIKYDFLC